MAKKEVPAEKNKNAPVSKEERDLKFRDLSITKVCDNCGKEYHPRKNSYQTTSRFCNAKCFREGYRKGLVAMRPIGRPPGR